MTKMLVVYASKMGATEEIAKVIGGELALAGLDVAVADATDVHDLEGYDAVVVGSAVYMAQWRPEAVRLLSRQAKQAVQIPTWLFQSGPCGRDARTQQDPAPKKVLGLAAKIGAAPIVTFGGRIERETAKGFIARKMAAGPLAGDFRDFDRIRRWAKGIAVQLMSTVPTGVMS